MGQPSKITSLDNLHWKFKKKLIIALENANKRAPSGVVFKVFESVRSEELQSYYYQQGRTRKGSIITNVKSPTFHNVKVGLAADVVPFVNGQPKWDRSLLKIWGEEAVKQGLTWGGNWKSFYDGAHVQLDGGLKSSDIRQGSRPKWFYDKETPQWKEDAVQWALKEGVIDSYHDPLEVLDNGTYLEIERKKRL